MVRGDAGAALALGPGRNPLPAKQESHEILCGDRLDLLAQTLLRIAVDAGEQPARAPLLIVDARIEVTTNDEALALEGGEADRHVRAAQSCLRRERIRSHRAAHLEVPAQDRGDERVSVRRAAAPSPRGSARGAA